jgi:hypothetical protein
MGEPGREGCLVLWRPLRPQHSSAHRLPAARSDLANAPRPFPTVPHWASLPLVPTAECNAPEAYHGAVLEPCMFCAGERGWCWAEIGARAAGPRVPARLPHLHPRPLPSPRCKQWHHRHLQRRLGRPHLRPAQHRGRASWRCQLGSRCRGGREGGAAGLRCIWLLPARCAHLHACSPPPPACPPLPCQAAHRPAFRACILASTLSPTSFCSTGTAAAAPPA